MRHRVFCRASCKSVWSQEAKPDPCPNTQMVEDSKCSPFWILALLLLAPPVPLDAAPGTEGQQVPGQDEPPVTLRACDIVP